MNYKLNTDLNKLLSLPLIERLKLIENYLAGNEIEKSKQEQFKPIKPLVQVIIGKTRLMLRLLILIVSSQLIFTSNSLAQPSSLTCNTPELMVPTAHGSMSQTNSGAILWPIHGVNNPGNVINSTTTDFATLRSILGTTEFLSVKDGAAGVLGYSAGSYAGFEIATTGLLTLSALSNITISTYLSGAFVESKAVDASLLSVSLLTTGTKGNVGFVTSAAFDEVRLTTSALIALGDIQIYNAVFIKYCAGPTLSCNTQTAISLPTYPLSINNANSGVVSGATATNINNAISSSTTDFATLSFTASVLSTSSISIIDNVTTYPSGTFAGFDIESANLLSVGALSSISISTYNNGVATGDVATGVNLIAAGSSILTGINRQVIGFVTSQSFDEVKLTINGVVVGLSSYKIYSAVLESFCSSSLPPCNTLSTRYNPQDPVYINGANTSVDAIACVACTISNSQNAIDNITSNFASIFLTAGVATSANFSVANALDTYPAGTFAGFDLESNTLLSAAVISGSVIKLYNNGTLVQTSIGNPLIVGATSSLLVGTTRQTAGIVSTVAFDEIQITFNQLVGADLGTIKIYSTVIEKTCQPNVLCNSSYYLNEGDFPTVINAQRTGVSGVVSALAGVNDAWNVVSPSLTDYATITNTAAVAALSSISVWDPITTYPNGTFAGFVISMPSAPLVLLDLFNAITISTYNNNVLQETKSGSSLIDLTVLARLIGTPVSGTPYNIGFTTTQNFDEIRISVSSLVGVSLLGGGLGSELNVYGAFIDTRTSDKGSALIRCQKTNPDYNTAYLGFPISGNVSTNDIVASNTKYGTPIADPSNPLTTLPVMNTDGTYTFSPTQEGVYIFSVPVCASDSSINCPLELLTITVLKSNIISTNPPVANTDIATTSYNTSVDINSLANDKAGDNTLLIDTSSITINDLNGVAAGNTKNGGTAIVNTTTGVISYTPPLNFIGTDTIQYSVCDNQSPTQCAQAYQVVTVLAPSSSNTTSASDDYQSTISGIIVTGNVKNNDNDAEGDNQTITANSISNINYTFNLLADGSYTFTPSSTFVGTANIVYQTCDDGIPPACANATLVVLVGYNYHTNPDINSGFVGTTISGDLSTNDVLNNTGTYGTPVADLANPSATLPTVNPDGTYSFVPLVDGVYKFSIPVCPTGMTSGCPIEFLTIYVLRPQLEAFHNGPVANTDIASTFKNTAVVINTLANDASGSKYTSMDTSSITLNDLNGIAAGNTSKGGTATVSTLDGKITYTPPTGFIGKDSISYTICDNQTPAKCATAYQIITVKDAGAPNSTVAADDYIMTLSGKTETGNVKNNDSDPEGNTQTVTSKSVSTADYSFTLLADGSYTFTSSNTFYGPLDITYQTCDNGTPSACANATIHVLIGLNWLTEPDFNAGFIGNTILGNVNTNDKIPTGSTYGSAIADAGNPAATLPTINLGGTYSFTPTVAGVYHFTIPVCPSGVTVDCPNEMLTITVLDNTVGATNPPLANTDIANSLFNESIVINTLANDRAGTPGAIIDPSSISITDLNGAAAGNTLRGGTAVADLGTGKITYTPALGFSGIDSIKYTICDNQTIPLCASAYQVINVFPLGAANSTTAGDDFENVLPGSTLYGNVKNNDSDPEGDAQTVSPQSISVTDYDFNLASDGSYTFTPNVLFTGPIDIVYETCDNGTPTACANATIHFLVSNASFPLPIQLIDFSAEEYNCNIQIKWVTTRNELLDKTDVQYSQDGKNWSIINMLPQKVTDNVFVLTLASKNGQNFFRLKLEKANGDINYTKTIPINSNCNSNINFEIFPNPSVDVLNISGNHDNVYYSITDLNGRKIKTENIGNNTKINIKDIGSGYYMLFILVDGKSKCQLIEIKKP